jgi:hypothetical protein
MVRVDPSGHQSQSTANPIVQSKRQLDELHAILNDPKIKLTNAQREDIEDRIVRIHEHRQAYADQGVREVKKELKKFEAKAGQEVSKTYAPTHRGQVTVGSTRQPAPEPETGAHASSPRTPEEKAEAVLAFAGLGSSVVPYFGDYGSLFTSIVAFGAMPSSERAGDVGLDAVGAALPIVPSLGTLRRVNRLHDAFELTQEARRLSRTASGKLSRIAEKEVEAVRAAKATEDYKTIKAAYNREKSLVTDAPIENFKEYIHPGGDVNIGLLRGSEKADFAAANRLAGFEATPPGFTWHHHTDLGRMVLVPTDVHEKLGHWGGVAIWSRMTGTAYR